MWDSIKSAVQALIDFIYRLFLSVTEFLKDFFWWLLDNLIGVAILMLDGLGTAFSGLNPLQYIDAIPNETKAMMAMTGFNECISIIIAAITIRFTLQLIPFVRWGS